MFWSLDKVAAFDSLVELEKPSDELKLFTTR